MNERREREILIEAATSAYRPRRPGGRVASSPAFHDLDEEGRLLAFQVTATSRVLEAAIDPEGLSSTARAVLSWISGRP